MRHRQQPDWYPTRSRMMTLGAVPALRTRWITLGSFALAFAFRLVGLGGSSMWLDEILETLMARGTLRELFSALLFDRAQPPLEPLLTWTLLALGLGELCRRLCTALIGALAVALFTRWVARRFGPSTAGLTALLLASSPVLIRYAHELRPYALALLLSMWALDATDRWLVRGGAHFPLELAAAAALASMTHYLAVVLWLPVAAAWVEARVAGRAAALGLRALAAVALSALPLALWFWLLAAHGGPRQESPVALWSWALLQTRFTDLLLRGYRGQEVLPGLALLFVLLAAIGLVTLARKRGGLTVAAGLVGGTVLVEGALLAAQRFSHLRYNQLGLLFLLTMVAAGIVALGRWLGRWSRPVGIAVATILAGVALAASLRGVAGYARHGRPDWMAVARAVRALGGPDARLVTTSQPVQISIAYYLDRYAGPAPAPRGAFAAEGSPGVYFLDYSRWPPEPAGVPTIYDDRARLEAEISRQPAGCMLLLEGGRSRSENLFAGLGPKAPILSLPRTGGARLFRFATKGVARRDCLPPPDFEFQPSKGYGDLLPWRSR